MNKLLSDALGYVISAVLGGGIVGTIFTLWVKHAFAAAEAKKEKDLKERQERFVIEDEYDHAVGRTLFWLKKGCERFEHETPKGYWNGDLGKAFERLEEVEQRKKSLDREQLAEINEKK